MKRHLPNASMKGVRLFLSVIILMLIFSYSGKPQTAIPNPVCYGQPINLFCTLPGCENPGATILWTNFSGSWTSSDRDPVINPGDVGYASDEFYLTVSYSPPPGGFSGGVTSVDFYPQIILTLTPTNATGCYTSNGSIDLMLSGGTPPFMFLWSNSATTQNLWGLYRGDYSVTVTDINSCQAIGSATVGPPNLSVGSISANQNIFSGTAPAQLTGVAPANGTLPTYQWQSSTDNVTFTAITGATNLNYQPGILTATMYYRQMQNASGTCGGPLPTNVVTVSTSSFSCGISTLSDIDGNTYNTVQIGDQCWMKQNLATTHYATGTAIPNITGNSAWGALGDNNTDDAYCWYNNDINNKNIYGALYTWAAAMGDNAVSSNTNPSGVQGACPTGWHLPSDAEWTQLTTFLGGLSVSGGKMKETGSVHWNLPNTGASNSSGYTGLPGGYRSSTSGSFSSLGNYGYGWSSRSSASGSTGYAVRLNYNDETVYRTSFSKSYGFSVRCLKNSCDIIGLILTPTPVRCFGLSDGAIELSVSGGTPDYTYLWSNNATTQNISDLTAGEYTVTVTDENGCQAIGSAIVGEPDELTLSLTPSDVSSCGGSDGSIDLEVSGGTPPFMFLWSNNANSQNISGLTADTYFVTVTDANSCPATSYTTVNEPCDPPVTPFNPHTLNISASSAELGWTRGGCEILWVIKYGLPGFNPETEGMEIWVSENPYTLTGLERCTTYEFYIQSACNSVSVSDLTEPVEFSTDCICDDLEDMQLSWVNKAGGAGSDRGQAVAIDANNNVYTTGSFIGTVLFGNISLTSFRPGFEDIFIAKQDGDGNFLWATSIHGDYLGGTRNDRGNAIAIAPNGNIFITGYMGTEYNFDSIAVSENHCFVAKLNNLGIVMDVETGHWFPAFSEGMDIAVTDNDFLYITGYDYYSPAQKGSNSGDTKVENPKHIFTMKLQQSNMAIVWRTDYLGLATDVGRGIAVDANGNAFITGNFSSNVITIPGSGSLTKIGKDDRITAKLNGITGSTDWIKQEGSPGTSYSGNDIALDNENNVYVTGHQNFSIWVGKYNNVSGSPIWQETMVHSTGGGQGLSLAMGPSSESAYITGYFSGTCLFNPPMGLTAVFQDMFILQLNDYDGGFISTLINEGLVSSGIEPGLHAIAVDPYGCIYTTGAFKQADFDPNGTYALTASGMQDAFFQKLCCCCINHDDFLDRVALGWHIIDLVDCQVSVGTGWFSISNTWINQFTECHYITTTEPDWGDGTVATPELTPANGIWQHTYSHTGKYGICAWVVELDNGNECWRELMCDTIVVCCDEPPPVYIDHHSVCNTLEMYEVPLNYTGNYCDVSWVQWYYKPCGTPSSGWIPYQITKNMFPLKFSPREFSEETCLDLKAEVHFNCNECGNMVSYAYNSINLCHPLTLNIQNPNPAWSCSTIPVPSPISADVVSYPPVSGCDYENIEWYWNYHEPAGLPVHTGNSYQPPSLEFKGESDDCYTEHIFTAKAYPKSEGCNVVTKTTRIRIYNPEIPPGTITIDPAETLPFCPGEDATLKYNPKCAESPFTYKWYAKTSATDWEFVSDNFEKSLLYNTNRLYETTWFKVAQSGRCLPEPMELEIQVKNPIEIVDFTATPDPCSENHVDLSLEFTPSPIPGEECHYSITWLRNGISIGNSQGIASPINFSYANNSGSVAGSYSAVIHDICCPKNSPVPSDTITIVPSCIPVITGPCYHCFNNNNPIVLSVLMILPPDKPCPVGNVCTYKWFRDGNLVQSGAGSVLLSDDAGEFRVEVTCQTENGTCIREVSHIVVQCDGPCQNFPFDMHIESTVVLPGISFKEHARNTLTAGDPYYYIVKPGGHSEFSACQRIHLLKGFTAEPGCYFRAYIRNLCCGEKSAEIVNSQLSWSEQIVEFRENNLYRIYPNPTTGSFTIEFLDTQIDIDNATTHVEIFNLIGNRVYCADLPFQKQYSISLAGQKPGMYTIRVVHKSKLGVDRIVRQ